MRKPLAIAAIGLAALLCAVVLLAVAVSYRRGQVFDAALPRPLVDLANRKERVYAVHAGFPPRGGGQSTTQTDLFYVGDSDSFDEFVAQYAKVEGASLLVIIHPGRASAGFSERAGWGPPEGGRPPYDWGLEISGPVGSPSGTPGQRKEGAWATCVSVYLGGKLELGKLKIPANVEVRSGGEIEKFVADHEAKRKRKAD